MALRKQPEFIYSREGPAAATEYPRQPNAQYKRRDAGDRQACGPALAYNAMLHYLVDHFTHHRAYQALRGGCSRQHQDRLWEKAVLPTQANS